MDWEQVYLDATRADRMPTFVVQPIDVTGDYLIGWVDAAGVWWQEIRRTRDDFVLLRTRNGQVVWDACE